MPGVPAELVSFLAELPAAERRARGTRTGARALTCDKQARSSHWCGSASGATGH